MKRNFTRTVTAVTSIQQNYPNLIKSVSWIASITPTQAALVIWATKNGISAPIGSDRVKLFGDNRTLVSQAVRYRNA
ncbi:hypothetical protein [Spirosoma sordidisoli]|uniref:Uncharacterized protein n=1 Tax=Spirosoma sordidisoli TaxID=2502893 RepID=A0A4Q2UUX7_9BACT|nr:hypothetical protein [Spirosoma sordidisoli]RYC70709.1 hypothetical protein EQG79_00725 [Spirosoma sordidisoli]